MFNNIRFHPSILFRFPHNNTTFSHKFLPFHIPDKKRTSNENSNGTSNGNSNGTSTEIIEECKRSNSKLWRQV